MNLPRVVIRENYNDYLNGKEVLASFVEPTDQPVWPGEHVLAFKESIAAESGVTVPRSQQQHYIGIEGTVIEIMPAASRDHPRARRFVKIQKL